MGIKNEKIKQYTIKKQKTKSLNRIKKLKRGMNF